jgi:hypothetical protein
MNASQPVRKNRRGLSLRLAGTLATLLLLFVLLRQQGWEDIGAALGQIEPWRLLLALGMMFISRTAVSLRWHALLHEVDPRIRLGDSLRLTYAGLFAANFLPTTIGGDVVRLAACIQLRIDAAVATASLVVDRLVGMAGMGLFLPWGVDRLARAGLPALTLAPPIFGVTLNQRWWDRLTDFLHRLLGHFRLWLRRPGALAAALGFTLVHQAGMYVSIELLLVGMGFRVGWLQIAGIWSLVYFITLIPISINGYGLQEVSTTLLYAHLAGISLEAAAVVALLQRLIQSAASLPGALFVPAILAAERKSSREGTS